MSADPDVDTLARLCRTATSLDATVLLFRRIPAFEIEFAALEMEDDLDLAAWDEAVLALADARGAVTPHDVDAYLGLGEELSQALVESLAREGQLAEVPAPAPAWDAWEQSPYIPLLSWPGRVVGRIGRTPADPRSPTQARVVKESGAPDAPLHRLTEEGTSSLGRGRRVVRFATRARLVFWANPLRFVDVESDRSRRFAQHHRDDPLKPEDVPEVFRTIDDVLALPPAERVQRIGIEAGIPGLRGRLIGVSPDSSPTLLGVEPGKTWEVRRLPEHRDGLLVVAGFATSMPDQLVHRTLIGSSRELRDDVYLPATTLLDLPAVAPSALLHALRSQGHSVLDLSSHGAFRVRAGADAIGPMLGPGEDPSDTFLPLEDPIPDWSLSVRVRALPRDRVAAERAFFLLLGRRRSALRAGLERGCMETAAALRAHWGEPFEPPPMGAVLEELWKSRELRPVLCERRIDADLITPYIARKEDHKNG